MELIIAYALTFVGTPYLWGGSNPMQGLDCSGLVQEILASAGMDIPGDQTAQGLFDYFSKNGSWNKPGAGSLVFFGTDALHVTHVAFMLDQYRIIEAGGGGHKVISLQTAIDNNAFVKVRHLLNRKDVVSIIKPDYSKIGLF